MASSGLKPGLEEVSPYYHGYITLLGGEDALPILQTQIDDTLALLAGPLADRGDHAYAPDKWTVKEVVLHVVDTERIFGYRGLRFARGDRTPLPGYEQNDYAPESGASRRSLASLADEFRAVRGATIALFRSFPEDVLLRRGTASGAEFTVRAIGAVIAGHERHHARMLRERYL